MIYNIIRSISGYLSVLQNKNSPIQHLLSHIDSYHTFSSEAENSLYEHFRQIVLSKNHYVITEGKTCRHLYFSTVIRCLRAGRVFCYGCMVVRLLFKYTKLCFGFSCWSQTQQRRTQARPAKSIGILCTSMRSLPRKSPE